MADISALLGNIISSTNKVKILEILRRKNASPEYIAKHIRIPQKVAEELIEELEADGLLSIVEGSCHITELGVEVHNQLKGIR
jgi:predicted transcriptional regulator